MAERGTLSTLVLRLCERDDASVEGVLKPSVVRGESWAWSCKDAAGWPSESRNARRASEFLWIDLKVAVDVVAEDSESDPVGVGGRAVLGAGRGGGGTDIRWLPPTARAIENMPMCW